jgi:glycerate 2-kinase
MAQAFEQVWDAPYEGVVVTRYGYAAPTRAIKVLEASHPVPDEAGLTAGKRLTSHGLWSDGGRSGHRAVCGGGSALLPAPAGNA